MFFINDENQTSERSKAYDKNYGTSYQQNRDLAADNPNFVTKYNQYNSSDQKYYPEKVEMEGEDFDTTGVIATIALFGSLILMIIYTISDFRYEKKRNLEKQNNSTID
jgi:hypothetical protein